MTTNARIEAVERATGRSWDDWLAYMASIDAERLTHHEIASALLTELEGMVDNLGWWARATAVAYEQSIGRRVPGQRPDGTFQTSVSRSTSLGMEALSGAWTDFAAADPDVLERIAGDVRVSGTANGSRGERRAATGRPSRSSANQEGWDRVPGRPGHRDGVARGQHRGQGGLDRDHDTLRGDDHQRQSVGPDLGLSRGHSGASARARAGAACRVGPPLERG